MAGLDVKISLQRYERARVEMEVNRSLFEDCYEYLLPFRNTFSGRRKDGTHERITQIYDSIGMIAATNFVNTMQSGATPAFTKWAELKAGPAIPNEDRNAVDSALQQISDTVFNYINASNFITAVSEFYFDVGVGSGVMFILEGDEFNPLNFVPVPMSEVAIQEGKYGTVDAVYRKHEVEARLIKQTWPNAKLNADLEKMISDPGTSQSKVDFVEAFYFDEVSQVYYYDVIHKGSQHLLSRQVFAEQPFVVLRWMKVPGFATGIGPFVMALPDNKTLNKMSEFQLRLAALNAFGVYTVSDKGVMNPKTAIVQPGAFIPVERNAGPNGPSISRLEGAGDFQLQEFMIGSKKDQIRQLMLDKRLPPESAGVRTAFEISERIKELQSDVGAAFGRLIFEFISPLMTRVLGILLRKGFLGDPEQLRQIVPDLTVDNFRVKIQVTSPIARQQSLDELNRFTQAFQLVAGMSPELAQAAFELDKIPEWVSDKLGSPASMVKSSEKIREELQQLAQAQQQQAAAAQGQLPAA